MKKIDAIRHAGGVSLLAKMLGVTPGAISLWGEVVPDARQLQIELLTNGALKSEPHCLDRIIGIKYLLRNKQPESMEK
jgi:transcriptional repressor of cell division inhibition gene dicB